MLYLTGDTHGRWDRLRHYDKILTEEDELLICGDFGLLWNGGRDFEMYKQLLSEFRYKILWIDGNHENFDMLNSYDVDTWRGGKVHHIVKDKIIHLCRGQVFDLCGIKTFTFGGGSSLDIEGGVLSVDDPEYLAKVRRNISSGLRYRVEHFTWWREEMPSDEEFKEGLDNLASVGNKVDMIVTHSSSNKVLDAVASHMGFKPERDKLTEYLSQLENTVEFKKWFCGHYHTDLEVDGKHRVLYHEALDAGLEVIGLT